MDHCDYGLTLNGGSNKSPITIDTIDTANHPELSAVGHSDRLLSINGYDLEKGKNLEAQYMLDYGDEPLEMVLRKKDSNVTYKVTALPIKKPALHPDGDYTGALATGPPPDEGKGTLQLPSLPLLPSPGDLLSGESPV